MAMWTLLNGKLEKMWFIIFDVYSKALFIHTVTVCKFIQLIPFLDAVPISLNMKPVVEMFCRPITVSIHELLLTLKNVTMYLLGDIKCNYDELSMPFI